MKRLCEHGRFYDFENDWVHFYFHVLKDIELITEQRYAEQ